MEDKVSLTYKEAKTLASTLLLKSKADYQACELPAGLVKNPLLKYKDEFEGWPVYLGKIVKTDKSNIENIKKLLSEGIVYSLKEWKEAIKAGIVNKKAFPVDLSKVIDKNELADIFFNNQHRLPLEKFIQILIKQNIRTVQGYQDYIATTGQSNLPLNPQYYYQIKWTEIKVLVAKQFVFI